MFNTIKPIVSYVAFNIYQCTASCYCASSTVANPLYAVASRVCALLLFSIDFRSVVSGNTFIFNDISSYALDMSLYSMFLFLFYLILLPLNPSIKSLSFLIGGYHIISLIISTVFMFLDHCAARHEDEGVFESVIGALKAINMHMIMFRALMMFTHWLLSVLSATLCSYRIAAVATCLEVGLLCYRYFIDKYKVYIVCESACKGSQISLFDNKGIREYVSFVSCSDIDIDSGLLKDKDVWYSVSKDLMNRWRSMDLFEAQLDMLVRVSNEWEVAQKRILQCDRFLDKLVEFNCKLSRIGRICGLNVYDPVHRKSPPVLYSMCRDAFVCRATVSRYMSLFSLHRVDLTDVYIVALRDSINNINMNKFFGSNKIIFEKNLVKVCDVGNSAHALNVCFLKIKDLYDSGLEASLVEGINCVDAILNSDLKSSDVFSHHGILLEPVEEQQDILVEEQQDILVEEQQDILVEDEGYDDVIY